MGAGCLYKINHRKDLLKVGEGGLRVEANRNRNKICRCTGEIWGWGRGVGIPSVWFGLRTTSWYEFATGTEVAMIGPSGVSWNYATIMIGRRDVMNARKGWGVLRGVTKYMNIARNSQVYRRGYEFLATSVRLSIFLLRPSLLHGKAMLMPEFTQVRLEREVILDQ